MEKYRRDESQNDIVDNAVGFGTSFGFFFFNWNYLHDCECSSKIKKL